MAKALILFHSQEFMNTAAMAEAVAEGLQGTGCEVDLFNTNDGRFDIALFPQYDCVAFGSPDYVATSVAQAMWRDNSNSLWTIITSRMYGRGCRG